MPNICKIQKITKFTNSLSWPSPLFYQRPLEPSGAPLEPSNPYICQINLDFYENWTITFWGPNWLIPLIMAIPTALSAPSRTLWVSIWLIPLILAIRVVWTRHFSTKFSGLSPKICILTWLKQWLYFFLADLSGTTSSFQMKMTFIEPIFTLWNGYIF